MPSPSAALVVELGLEPPLQGTVESWLLDTMDRRLAYPIAMRAVWQGTSVAAQLRSMLKLTQSHTPLGWVWGLRGPLYTAHIFHALRALN